MLQLSPIDVISSCIARDLHILRLAIEGLQRHLSVRSITVATARHDFGKFRNRLGSSVHLIDEDEMIPGMTIGQLTAAGLCRQPGWYFQQLLKFSYVFHRPAGTHFLIWDADTVLLRPVELFDESGRVWFTKADEFHEPYFETYSRLFGHDAQREFSFIAQHMTVDEAQLREMLRTIEEHCPGDDNWAWKIMRAAQAGSFSEYETFGHYVKNRHPGTAAYRRLPWLRDGALVSYYPSQRQLKSLGERFAFAAFENKQSPLNRASGYVRRILAREGPLLPAFLRPTRNQPAE